MRARRRARSDGLPRRRRAAILSGVRTRREPDRIAFIAEEADWGVEEGDIFTGRFFGHLEAFRLGDAVLGWLAGDGGAP